MRYLRLTKYWVDKILKYITAFGVVKGVSYFFKLRIFRSETPIFIEGITLRPTHADISVFEKFYVYLELDLMMRKFFQGKANQLLDLGGNVGLASRRFLELNEDASVWIVEPSSENLSLLKKNLANFERVHLVAGAVGAKSGYGTFADASADHDAFQVEAVEQPDETVDSFPVHSLTELIESAKPDVIKCDVEGAEYELFSESNPISFTGVDLLSIEVHSGIDSNEPASIDRYFLSKGFERHVLGEDTIFVKSS